MIDVYPWPTPNGHKVHIMLEECGLPYQTHAIHIGRGDQFQPDFLKISPNNKIPAIVDSDWPDGQPIALFESGAILLYLAAKVGRLPQDVRQRYDVLQWLMFQMGGVGPMGQAHHPHLRAREDPLRGGPLHRNEARRLYGVMNEQIRRTGAHIAGPDYSIADIAIYPWLRSWQNQGIDWADFPQLKDWLDRVGARPAVRRGEQVLADQRAGLRTDAEKEVLARRRKTLGFAQGASRLR